MRKTFSAVRRSLARVAPVRRLLFGLALLTLVVPALPVREAEAGGARFTASYSIRTGQVTVQGERLQPGIGVVVFVRDVSQNPPVNPPTDTELATVNKRGRFSVTTNFPGGICPRVIHVEVFRNNRLLTRFEEGDSQCPW